MTEFIVFIVILLTALACTLVGNFLVLRKLSLMGDAISHAVLPGIVLAFLLIGSLDSPLFFGAAVLFGLFMSFLIQYLSERVRFSSESVIGIVFTFLFAVGVVLIVQFADNVHLDQDAILFGQVEFAAWNRFIFSGFDLGPRAIWQMGFVFCVNMVLIALFYKEFKICAFDPKYAKSVSVNPKLIHYLLMFMTSLTVVTAFEVVGPILVVALLIVPSATAYIFAKRLSSMMVLSFFFAFLAVVFGFLFAINFDVSIAGSVASFSGLILFIFVVLKSAVRSGKGKQYIERLGKSR